MCQSAASVEGQQETVQQLPEVPVVAQAETLKDVPAVVEDAKPVEAAKEPAQESAQEAVQEPVKEAVQEPVETDSLTITFELKGKTTDVKFEKRPLGFSFAAQRKGGCCSGGAETGKYVVTKVDKKGLKEVKVGMVIKRINDTEVPDKKEWVEFQEMMALAAKPLPEEEAASPAPAPTKPEDAPMEDVTAKAPEAAPAAPETAPQATKAAELEAAKATGPAVETDTEPAAAATA